MRRPNPQSRVPLPHFTPQPRSQCFAFYTRCLRRISSYQPHSLVALFPGLILAASAAIRPTTLAAHQTPAVPPQKLDQQIRVEISSKSTDDALDLCRMKLTHAAS